MEITSIRLQFLGRTNRCGTTPFQVTAERRFVGIPNLNRPRLTKCQADAVFSGISTFGRLPYFPCLASDDEKFDIAFLGSRYCSMAKLTQILTLCLQALHLTLALRTALGLGLAQAASDKVLAASISSTLISMLEAYFWWLV